MKTLLPAIVLVACCAALPNAAQAGGAPYTGQPVRTGTMYNGRNVAHLLPGTNATTAGQSDAGDNAVASGQDKTSGGTAGAGGTSGGGTQLGGEH